MLESVLSQPQPQGGDSVEEHPAGPCCCFPKVGRARGLGVHVSAVTGLQGTPSSKAEDAPAKEEPKQADVPAAVTAAAATAPAAEDAAAMATAQPPTETAESSQAEEKIGERPPGSDGEEN